MHHTVYDYVMQVLSLYLHMLISHIYKWTFFVFIAVLPPVLVPRYSEFPAGHGSPPSLPPFQQAPEPAMPQNISFDPNGFHPSQGPNSPGSSGPGSPYGLPGNQDFLHL